MKARTLSEPEQQARKKRDGLTAREFRAKHSKFKHVTTKNDVGSFEVQVLMYGNDLPQTAPFNNRHAALARFEKMTTNPNVSVVKLVQYTMAATGESKKNVLLQVVKTNQTFANSKTEIFYRRKGSNDLFGKSAIEKQPALQKLYLEDALEVARYASVGGHPWWERRA